jgi:D-sedoheptulose 7-phosphate isomerase
MTVFQKIIEDAVAATRSLAALEPAVNRAADLVAETLLAGQKILLCGNGGSASDATHWATEILCRFKDDRRPYPAVSLTANGEYLTAVCNDYSGEEIFARQVWGLGRPGDLLIVLTTSGKSRNVVRALEEARKLQMRSMALLGRDGGFTKGLSTLDLIVPGDSTARIQEAHTILFHAICEMVETRLPKT